MKKLDLSKQEKEIVDQALQYWEDTDSLSHEQANLLRDTIQEKGFEWKVLARYAFWIALVSLVLSVLSLFADDALVRFVTGFYEAPNIVFCGVFGAIACFFYLLGFRHKNKYPDKNFSNETMMLAGAFATAACIGFLGQVLDRGTSQYTLLFLLSIGIYAFLAVKLDSTLLWVFTLVALGIWFATETAYRSNWGFKFWGMNYPLRFTLFGMLLTIFSAFVQPRIARIRTFQPTSYVVGLLYTMIALWCLSIFGNYASFDDWTQVRQFHILYWGVLAILLSLALALYGMKTKDNASRDIGFVFFILNLYTRFVEYLWDNINRTIFFLVLALSFWLVGRWAEKLWRKDSPN